MQISKFNKATLANIDTEYFVLPNVSGMTVSHYLDSTNSSFYEFSFTVSATDKQIIFINEIDYLIAMREKVDLSVLNSPIPINDNSPMVKNNIPFTPIQLDNGFIELKGET